MFKSIHQPSRMPQLETFGDFLYYAYANMQMLIMALSAGKNRFDPTCFMVRSKAFKAYREGRWNIRDLHINNFGKLKSGDYCWYCLKDIPRENLTIEHIFPRSKEGADDMDNIVLVCKSCNSSKRDLDLLEWYHKVKQEWPLPYIFAYYLKHVYLYAVKQNLLNKTSDEINAMDLPFKYEYIPLHYPDSYLEKSAVNYDKSIRPDNPKAYTAGK